MISFRTPKRLSAIVLLPILAFGGTVAMPPVCTKVADAAGLATLRQWISSLPP